MRDIMSGWIAKDGIWPKPSKIKFELSLAVALIIQQKGTREVCLQVFDML